MKKILILFVIILILVSAFSIIPVTRYLRKVNYYQPFKILILSPVKMNDKNFSPFGQTPAGKILPFKTFRENEFNHGYSFFRDVYIKTDSATLVTCSRINIYTGNIHYIFDGPGLMRYKVVPPASFTNTKGMLLLRLPPALYTSSPGFIILLSVFRWKDTARYLYLLLIFSFIITYILNRLALKSNKTRSPELLNKAKMFKGPLHFVNKLFSFLVTSANHFSKGLLITENKIPYRSFTVILTVMAILPFLYLAFSTFPTPEEIQISSDAIRMGVKYPSFVYRYKDGRYFTNLLYLICPLTWKSVFGYRLELFALMIMLWGSLLYFMSTILRNLLKRKQIIEWWLLVLFMFSCLMPSVASGYFWLFAVLTYIVPLILLFILLALLFDSKGKKLKIPKVSGICLMVIMICGSHEMYLTLTAGIFFYITVRAFYKKDFNKYYYLIFLILTISCIVFVLKSPGHMNRIQFNNTHRQLYDVFSLGNLLNMMSMVMRSVVETFDRNIKDNIIIVILSLISLPVLNRIILEKQDTLNIFQVNPLWALAGFVLLMFVPVIPYFMVGENGYLYMDRLFNIICLFFILGWFYTLFVLIHYLRRYGIVREFGIFLRKRALSVPFKWFMVMLFVMYLFNSDNNIYIAYDDIFSGRVKEYRRQLNERFLKMREPKFNVYKGNSLFVVFPLTVKPFSIYYQDYDNIVQNNIFSPGAEHYFNLNELRCMSDTVPYDRPLLMTEYRKNSMESGEVTNPSGIPVFSSNLTGSFASRLFGSDPASSSWFIYKYYYFGYDMYDTTFRIDKQLWSQSDQEGMSFISSVKFMDLAGDTIFRFFSDTLVPRPGNPCTFEHYSKYKLYANKKVDRQFIEALMQNRIIFAATTRYLKQDYVKNRHHRTLL